MENETLFEKTGKTFKVMIKEYVIGTSIFLLSLFILNLNNQNSNLNLILWIIINNCIFEKVVLDGRKRIFEKSITDNIAKYGFRLFFITMNIVGFGVHIFN